MNKLLAVMIAGLLATSVFAQATAPTAPAVVNTEKADVKSQFKITELSDAYWRVTFSNPPVNMVNPETILEFRELVDRIEASKTLRVVVFDSAHPDYFFARYDVARAAETPSAPGPTGFPTWIDMTVRISQSPVVSIALIRGRTRGGGSELALAMDMRFASLEKAIFGQPEVGAGVFPGGGALERLPALTGRARALEIVLGSEDFNAATAERYGWINRALPDAELNEHVDRLARRIASFDREALAETKRLMNRRTLPDPRDLLESGQAFRKSFVTWPTTRQRLAKMGKKAAEVGPAEFEKNIGRYLGELR